jgi:hypothetical protein
LRIIIGMSELSRPIFSSSDIASTSFAARALATGFFSASAGWVLRIAAEAALAPSSNEVRFSLDMFLSRAVLKCS